MTQESEPLARSPQVGLEVAPTEQRVLPGGRTVFQINIANRTDEAQSQSLELAGLSPDWFSLDFDERRVAFPQEQRTASLMVSVPQDAEPVRQPFRVVVRAGSAEAAVECSLEVLAAADVPAPRGEPVAPPAPTVSLSQALVTWGGDPGEVESLTVTVRNEGRADTDYALSLEGLPEASYTLTPRLRIGAEATLTTELRIHPDASTDVGDYPFKVRASVEGYPDVAAEVQGRLSVAPPAPAAPPPRERPADTPTGPAAMPPEVSLERTTFDFGPGVAETNVLLTVQNKSNLIEHYELEVMGIPDDWYSLQTTDLRLEPGAGQDVMLRLTPHTGPGLPAGDYDFRVRVAPSRFPDSFRDVGGRMSIAGVAAFDGRLSPVTARGRKEKFKLTLANKGSIPMSLTVIGSDPDAMCKFDIPPLATLEPEEERIVPVRVGANRNGLLGYPETFDFRLRAAPAGATESTAVKTFDAQFVHQPFLSSRFAFLSLLVTFLITVVGVIVVLGWSRVDAGFDWVDCGRSSEYQRDAGGPQYKKQKCGGAPEWVQCEMLNDQQCHLTKDVPPNFPTPTPTPAPTPSPTPIPSPTPTPEGGDGPGATCDALGEGCEATVTNIGDVALAVRESPSPDEEARYGLLDGALVCITGASVTLDGATWWPLRLLGGSADRNIPEAEIQVGPDGNELVEGWALELDPTNPDKPWLTLTGEPCE